MKLAKLVPALSPVMVNVPHAGTYLPDGLVDRMTDAGKSLPDTDWHVHELYGFVESMGIGLMQATHSRYVIDLNRPADEKAVYGQRTTGLVPTETFAGDPVYVPGCEPDRGEQLKRTETYWKPYHECLQGELSRIRAEHGWVVMLDAHSIGSRVPALFDGELPHLNLGTFSGQSADPGLVADVSGWMQECTDYRSVRDGRFKGGFNTRNYGQPALGQHALQLELSQATYLHDSSTGINVPKMELLQTALKELMHRLLAWRPGRDS